MRFFEARPLLHEIGCALGKAHNVFHLKGVLRRPLRPPVSQDLWCFGSLRVYNWLHGLRFKDGMERICDAMLEDHGTLG